MARAKNTDFFHNFRFHVVVTGFGEGSAPRLKSGTVGDKPQAGFSSVSIPEATQDAVEYREGHYIYTRKYSGLPSISNVTLSRGVALGDSTFWYWMKDVIEGNAEYRANVSIFHFHRDSKPATSSAPAEPNTTQGVSVVGSLEYKIGEAFPIRNKISADLSATENSVSITEIELAIEYFDVIDHSIIP
jgi:phage tail-like protein